MGRPGMVEKHQNPMTHYSDRCHVADPIWARPVVVCREIWPERSSGGGAPPWPARVARGWQETPPTAKTRLS